jgi:Putative Ig domain
VGVAPDVQREPPAPEAVAIVRRLLGAYADTLAVIDSLPVVPMVATGWHWRSRTSAPIRLPRVSWMLRSLMLWHIDRVLAGVEQRFHQRSALGIAGVGEADALGAVAEFRASLSSPSRALRVGVLALAALVVAQLLARLMPPRLAVDTRLPAATATNQLFDSTLGALQLTANSVGSAVDILFKASPAVLVAAVVLLSASLYLILRPVASAFRLKRLLLNLYPDADSKWSNTPASWSMSRSVGVYSREQETFKMLEARAPVELPLDLLVSLPIPIIGVVWLVGLIFTNAQTSFSLIVGEGVVLGICGVPAANRLAWLAAVWRARRGGPRSAWLFTEEVIVPWRSKPVRCRAPVLIGWVSLLVALGYVLFFLIFPAVIVIVIVWWLWRSTARDLRDLGDEYDVKHLRDMRPTAEAFAAGPGLICILPALIMIVRASRYVRDAQETAELPRPVSHRIAWLAPVWPVLCVLLQRELNRAWQAIPLRVTTTSLPDGTANSAYSASLAAAGGVTPYTWSVSSGSLPAGLTLSPSGAFAGTPTDMGTFDLTVLVTDSALQPATVIRALSITVAPPLTPTIAGPPEATVNPDYPITHATG